MKRAGKGLTAFGIMAVLFTATAFGVVFSGAHSFAGRAQEAVAAPLAVTEAVTSEVCMVNDRVFGKPQIPVEFEGKTYYGCCQGCVNRIKNDRSVRYSKDPVTGSEVDKATAFITEGPGGEALYFESRETATEYSISKGE